MLRISKKCRFGVTVLLAIGVSWSLLLSSSAVLRAEQPVVIQDRLPIGPVPGSLVVCGGGPLPAPVIDRFLELAGGLEARIVIITTASGLAGTPELNAKFDHWLERKPASMTFLHTRDRDEANTDDFSKVLVSGTAVWLSGGNQNWLTDAYLGTLVEKRCHELLQRGGVIGGTSAGAAVMSKTMISGGLVEPTMASGFGFLPGIIVDQHFRQRNRQGRLFHAMNQHPGSVGIGIDESTAVVVRGRSLEVIGDAEVTVCLTSSDRRPARVQSLTNGNKEDLVQLSRAAIARAQSQFAKTKVAVPEVKDGTLIITGEGPTPREAIDKFLFAAGGKDSPIIVVSNASGEEPPEEQFVCGWLTDAGASNVRQLHVRSQSDLANADLKSVVQKAKGVWFTGGRQSRLVDAYLDTPFQTLFREVLQRGGVIGGTSGGAAMQGEYLVQGHPVGLKEQSGEGYERGFGFFPGVAIDQHLAQQDRFDEMTELKKSYPQMVGLGIHEATALIVTGTTMEVVGKSQVSVFARQPDDSATGPEYEVVKAGQSYDFKQRRRVDTSLAIGTADSTPAK